MTPPTRKLKEPQLALEFATAAIDYNLIDAEFNVQFANTLAERESFNKHLYRPNTYLHKWWARRCGTTFRAILKHLVRDRTHQDFYAPGGLEGQIILDPMMGGGTTLHEAIRLGANVIGADIDPIPILQARATLTPVSLAELECEFAGLMAGLQRRLGHLYRCECPDCGAVCDFRFILYGLRRSCACGEALFVDTYVLRHNPDDSVLRIDPATYDILRDDTIVSRRLDAPTLPLYEKGREQCTCGIRYTDDLDVPYYRRYVPVAVAGECAHHGFFFAAPTPADLESIAEADRKRASLPFRRADFVVAPGPKSSDLVRRGIPSYLDLYASRQLLFLNAAMNAMRTVTPAARLKLALLISTATEFNSLLCGYKGSAKNRPGAVRHTFTQHAYAFPYTALENNPLYDGRASGTLRNLFESRLVRGQRWAELPVERLLQGSRASEVKIPGEVDAGVECHSVEDLQSGTRRFLLVQGSSVSLPLPAASVDHIVTDPPYFDSVQYSDLAAYFRVWLRQLLPDEANWDYSLDAAAVNQQQNGSDQYAAVLADIFRECHRVLRKEHGRLVFTFHHWNPQGWAGLTKALMAGDFVLINRYVIHAENPSSVHIVNQNALVHDAVLVLGSRGTQGEHAWTLPATVDKTDSESFCAQCAQALGYMLETACSADEIVRLWNDLVRV